MEKLLGSFDNKKGQEQVRVYAIDSNGKTYISIRMYSYRAGDWHLTKKGVTVPKSKAYKLGKAIAKAVDSISNYNTQDVMTV